MNIIQRTDKDEDAKGCDYFGGFFLDGESPFWVTKERALLCEKSNEIAQFIHSKYGYNLIVGTMLNDDRKTILSDMKSGKISKEEGINKLKHL